MNEQAPRAGQAGDTGKESEVLLEAAAALADWVSRLPEDSVWRTAFAEIGSEVAACAELHELPHRWRVA